MNIKISVNKNKKRVDRQLVEFVVKTTFKELRELDKIELNLSVEISIALVDSDQISALNEQYRKYNGPTDVLSFCYEKGEKKLEGEIILCFDIIKENALEDGVKFEEELSKNIIHSILHIVGYEHGEEMFVLQNNILKAVHRAKYF